MESAINTRSVTRPSDRRAYLAGGGATVALVGAAIIIFIAVAALVDFDGLPFGSTGATEETVNLTSDAPLAAAAAAGATADSVAASAEAPGPQATAEIVAALALADPAAFGFGYGSSVSGQNLTGTGPSPPGGTPGTPGPAAPGALGNVVAGVDGATAGLGIDLGLGGLTKGITAPIDKTLGDTVNGLGSIIGEPKLGDKVGSTVSGITGGLLGSG